MPTSQESEAADEISQILSARAVKYTHQNDELLRPSRIEEESLRDSLNVRVRSHVMSCPTNAYITSKQNLRKRKAKELAKAQERNSRRPRTEPEPEPEPEWPPRRRHHKTPLSPKSKYALNLLYI